MSREKTLEICGGECPHIGWVTLAETGNKRILARARLGASHVLTEAEKEAKSEALSHLSYKKPWAWPIEELEPLPCPIYIPSWVASGAVRWVTRERWETFDAEQSSQSLPATTATTLRNGRGRARKTAARPCILWREGRTHLAGRKSTPAQRKPAEQCSGNHQATTCASSKRRSPAEQCPGWNGRSCQFSASIPGAAARLKHGRKGCIFCCEDVMSSSLSTSAGRGSLIRLLKALKACENREI